jgi:Transposase DDE domain
MAHVSSILTRISKDLEQYLPEESALAAFRAAGHEWRERQLGPVRTLHLFILQVLACNTAMAHLRHLAGEVFSLAGYCQARARLPLSALQTLLRDSSAATRAAMLHKAQQAGDGDAGLWHGLRAFLVDGSSTITPDTPALQETFGQPGGCKQGCGFPVPKLLALFDAFTGMVVEMLGFALFTHEQSKVWMLHPLLKAGDLLVGDRGFCSFVHLALLQERGVHACFRCHQRQIVDFGKGRKSRDQRAKSDKTGRPTSQFVRRLGKHDQIVRWKRPPKAPAWMTPEQWATLPQWLEVRELRYTLASKGQRTHVVTIATTLLDEKLYPKEDVAELYGMRWRVETRFAELKTTLKMRKLKSKSPEGVMKELAVYCLVYNMVRTVTTAAALRQRVAPDRISFIDALRWLLLAQPGAPIPNLIVNPVRDRHEPRVVKDRIDTYTKMTRPRAELKKELNITTGSLK